MHICDVDSGEFLLSYDEQVVYRDSWMKPAPQEAKSYELATIQVITEQEYNDIIALLGEDEPVLVEPVPVENPIIEHEEPEQAKIMTLAEMREMIKTQQQQIESLMELVTTPSK